MPKSKDCVDYLNMKMISNGKYLNDKLVDLVQFYNLCIKLFFVRVHRK
jgi:hypothetical protein